MPTEDFTQEPVIEPALVTQKKQLRSAVLARRRELTAEHLTQSAESLVAHVLALPQVRSGACVAAYVSMGTEPGTAPLLEALHAHGVRVLLPVVRPDNDLDWAPYAGPEALAPVGRGMQEPTTAPLGTEAITWAELVLVPGLAVSTRGDRLGRGGGSYDRALARVSDSSKDLLVAVVLHPDEVGLDVPVEVHDHPVGAVLTCEGVVRLPE